MIETSLALERGIEEEIETRRQMPGGLPAWLAELERDEVGADELVAGPGEVVAVQGQPCGERGVGVIAPALRIAHGHQEQVQRPAWAEPASRRCSRTRRWSTQLNCSGVRRRRCGHSNLLFTIAVLQRSR